MRDLRDPQKLGEFLLRNKRPNKPLHFTADELTGHADEKIPEVSKDDSLCKVTQAEYRAELEAAAAAGDRYAKSRLETL
jgi:hypothetical protein